MGAATVLRTRGADSGGGVAAGAVVAARAASVRRTGGAPVVAAVMAVSACSPAGDPAPSTSVTASSASGEAGGCDAATRGDEAFNATFSHEFADVGGVRMHYVTGGSGPALVLLHGWPQSWFEWREIMPALAEEHTVYALDLPGLGDSQGEPAGYDKATLARYVHALVSEGLGLSDVGLVGHDLGAGVGYQYAAQLPDEVTAYAHLYYPLPGPALSAAQFATFSWHVAFHSQPQIPEMLVDDEVRDYLAAFYPLVASGGTGYGGPGAEQPLTDAQIEEFARTHQRPQVLSGGFDLHRTLDQDEQDTIAAAPVAVPTLLLSAEGGMAGLRPTVEPRLTNVQRAIEVPGSGHRLPEENPGFVTAELLAFFAATP